MADPTMTAEEIAPMSDDRVAALRYDHTEMLRTSSRPIWDARSVAALLARLEEEVAGRKAAEARALPTPRLMESLEDVRGLPRGTYWCARRWAPTSVAPAMWVWRAYEHYDDLWFETGDESDEPNTVMVGAYVSGPLPDLDVPGEG